MGRYNLSFITAWFNLADFGTKFKGPYASVGEARARNCRRIGLLSRSEMRLFLGNLANLSDDHDSFSPILYRASWFRLFPF